ncbi:PilZ domain-containing protein [Pararhodobacter oceanensis]|uniref:PilZ domain-containing protein n=1 Tax=Pararhodobacter oceanensis TaxID=2172121 RepID=A0A2T8HUM3_9RHOB|nr:PilZ domain-containing protein [Pararhodobacter oceanensis]PVH29121.1 hypothetical protein DDE20_08855 [Pararhodobacter oceanensis]
MQPRAARLPTRALIHVRTPTSEFDATIGNVSADGARLLGVPDDMLEVGDTLEIVVGNYHHLAEVRWHIDDTCGLAFNTSLSALQIATILGSQHIH